MATPNGKNDVAIVVMASWGDVLISTYLVRLLKQQRPNTHITYYTSSACAGAIHNNPDIDSQHITPASIAVAWEIQDRIISMAQEKHRQVILPWAGRYPQHDWKPIDVDKPLNFMWCAQRTAQLIGLEASGNIKLYLYPTQAEITRAISFINSLTKQHTTLMETQYNSSQSWWNAGWTTRAIDMLISRHGGNILISLGGSVPQEIIEAQSKYPGHIYVLNNYSLREVSVIYNFCDVMISVSSGTSNACHGHQCKSDIKWFEVIRSHLWDSSPIRANNKHFHYAEDPSNFFDVLSNTL